MGKGMTRKPRGGGTQNPKKANVVMKKGKKHWGVAGKSSGKCEWACQSPPSKRNSGGGYLRRTNEKNQSP